MQDVHNRSERGSRSDEVDADPDDWPTTLRFSRRAGENYHGADDAAAVESSGHATKPRLRRGTAIAFAGALLAATLVGLVQMA